jgi:hypothetical protein
MEKIDQVRRLFEEFLGTERFEKFVAQGFKPRLRFWQEQELEKFYLRRPDLRCDLAEIQVILRICQVHRTDLREEAPKAKYDSVTLVDRHPQITRKYFPNARTVAVGTAAIWYCDTCRVVLQKWEAGTLSAVDER